MPSSLLKSDDWKFDVFSQAKRAEIDRRFQDGGIEKDGKVFRHSHSGSERNHLFLSNQGKAFEDLSAVSGLDAISDSRTFVLWDFNRDGWQDIALVNADTPLLNLFRNDIGQQDNGSNSEPQMIAIRLVGGNRTGLKSSEFACRDGYGAKITVDLGDMSIRREHRCGEGFAAQNSATMIIGIGDSQSVNKVTVRWPSGTEHSIANVKAGILLNAYEDTSESPDRSGFDSSRYNPLR